MESMEVNFVNKSRYIHLLGEEQANKLLNLFAEIERGKYDKNEIHSININGFKYPIYIRAIRADMQSFVNTFIDPYLEKKAYLSDMKYLIDAGANIGYTAVLYANWWPECKIISIEPDQENYDLTLKNVGPYKNITVLNGALWNKEVQLKIEAGQEDGFVVREISNLSEETKTENLTVGFSLKQLLDRFNFPHIDFLKMNIEGSEKDVFSVNYQSWLPDTKAMLIELHDGKNAGCAKTVFTTINKYDFAVAETAPYGVLFVKEYIYRTWYANWYKEEIYTPNINKERFQEFFLDKENK